MLSRYMWLTEETEDDPGPQVLFRNCRQFGVEDRVGEWVSQNWVQLNSAFQNSMPRDDCLGGCQHFTTEKSPYFQCFYIVAIP